MAHASFSLPTTVKFCFGATEQNMEMKLDNIASLGNKRSKWQTQKNNKSRIGNNFAARQARQKSIALRSSMLRQGKLADMRHQITQSKIAATQTAERRATVAAMSVRRLRDSKNDAGRWNSSFQRSPRFTKQYQLSRDISAHNSKISVLKATQK
ncbi:hypothetical protein O6H91_Y477100 [Diphasiastrum complanatum]|nr:hypothetical protein O6H91_Y477100 [Diphasiastrum complanatum]